MAYMTLVSLFLSEVRLPSYGHPSVSGGTGDTTKIDHNFSTDTYHAISRPLVLRLPSFQVQSCSKLCF